MWNLDGADNQNPQRIFNLQNSQEESGQAILTSKPLLHKLLETLTRDIFRPLPLGSLVAELYPDEYFNPVTSPQKAYQATVRLRDWFVENQIPMDVNVEGESYRLVANSAYAIRLFLDLKQTAPEKKASELEQLSLKMQNRIFTAADVAHELGISSRSAQRLLEKALSSRMIVKLWRSFNRYKLIQKS